MEKGEKSSYNDRNRQKSATSNRPTSGVNSTVPTTLSTKIIPSAPVIPSRKVVSNNINNNNGNSSKAGPSGTAAPLLFTDEDNQWLLHQIQEYFKEMRTSNFSVIPSWNEALEKIEPLLDPSNASNSNSGSSSNGNGNNNVTMMSIPFGFQNIRSITLQHPTLKLAAYNAAHDTFLGIDSHVSQMWQGSDRIRKFDDNFGISKIIYVEQFHVYVAGTSDIHLKVFDANMNIVHSQISVKPAVCFKFVEASDELIVGSIGNVMIWQFCSDEKHSFVLRQRLSIPLTYSDQWVNDTFYDPVHNKIYAVADQSIYILNFKTGEIQSRMDDVHDGTITSCIFYYPYDYIVTGAKDSKIRCWNSNHILIHEFRDNLGPITGIFALEKKFGPCIVASSMDKTIRMYNLESFQCIYRLDTAYEIMDMTLVKSDQFYTLSKQSISLWFLNKNHNSFCMTRSPVRKIQLCSHPKKPHRFLVMSEDGSVRLVNQYHGQTLFIAMPSLEDYSYLLDAVYNQENEKIYAFTNSGMTLTYDANFNPCRIIKARKTPGIAAFAAIELYNNPQYCQAKLESQSHTSEEPFWIFAGTNEGQLHILGKSDLKWSMIQQAHTAEISHMHADSENLKLYTTANDKTLRIWQIVLDGNILSGRFHLDLISSIPVAENFTQLNHCRSLTAFASTVNQLIIFDEVNQEFLTHGTDEDHIREVSCVASSYSLKIFASGSSDGIVKLWDSSNALLREIQFNEPILSLCFANEKGDLLIGLSNQIAVIRCYDYLPVSVLKYIVQMAPYFKDNPVLVDRPHIFDPDSEYWNLPHTEPHFNVNFEQIQLDRLIQMLRKVDDEDEDTGNEIMDPFRVSLLKMKIRKKLISRVSDKKVITTKNAEEYNVDEWFGNLLAQTSYVNDQNGQVNPESILRPTEYMQLSYVVDAFKKKDPAITAEKIMGKTGHEEEMLKRLYRNKKQLNQERVIQKGTTTPGTSGSTDITISKKDVNVLLQKHRKTTLGEEDEVEDITKDQQQVGKVQYEEPISEEYDEEDDDEDDDDGEGKVDHPTGDKDIQSRKKKLKTKPLMTKKKVKKQTEVRLTSKQILTLNKRIRQGSLSAGAVLSSPETINPSDGSTTRNLEALALEQIELAKNALTEEVADSPIFVITKLATPAPPAARRESLKDSTKVDPKLVGQKRAAPASAPAADYSGVKSQYAPHIINEEVRNIVERFRMKQNLKKFRSVFRGAEEDQNTTSPVARDSKSPATPVNNDMTPKKVVPEPTPSVADHIIEDREESDEQISEMSQQKNLENEPDEQGSVRAKSGKKAPKSASKNMNITGLYPPSSVSGTSTPESKPDEVMMNAIKTGVVPPELAASVEAASKKAKKAKSKKSKKSKKGSSNTDTSSESDETEGDQALSALNETQSGKEAAVTTIIEEEEEKATETNDVPAIEEKSKKGKKDKKDKSTKKKRDRRDSEQTFALIPLVDIDELTAAPIVEEKPEPEKKQVDDKSELEQKEQVMEAVGEQKITNEIVSNIEDISTPKIPKAEETPKESTKKSKDKKSSSKIKKSIDATISEPGKSTKNDSTLPPLAEPTLLDKKATVTPASNPTPQPFTQPVKSTNRYNDLKITDDLKKVVNATWFPGLEDKPPTVKNIVDISVSVLNDGKLTDKIEAITALHKLYQTQKQEIRNPLFDLVHPQLISMYDESWEVRAHTCLTISKYNIYDPELISVLISRLGDVNDTVRAAAKAALVYLGVNCKDELTKELVRMGQLKKIVETVVTDEERTLEKLKVTEFVDKLNPLFPEMDAMKSKDKDKKEDIKAWIKDFRALGPVQPLKRKQKKSDGKKNKRLLDVGKSDLTRKGKRPTDRLKDSETMLSQASLDDFVLPDINASKGYLVSSGSQLLLQQQEQQNSKDAVGSAPQRKKVTSSVYLSNKEKCYLRKAMSRRDWIRMRAA